MRPRLDNVTLCRVDCLHPEIALLAMRRCLDQCDFAASVLLTDQEVEGHGTGIRRIAPIRDAEACSMFIMRGLLPYIETDFVLIVQWDGFVLDGSSWDPEFLKCDYIGTPWHWLTGNQVGNGGFSLRSRRLLEELLTPDFPPSHPEDTTICRRYHDELVRRGIKFALVRTAERFAFERDEPSGPTFGFHGLVNFWRIMPLPEFMAWMAGVSPTIHISEGARELVISARNHGRYGFAGVL